MFVKFLEEVLVGHRNHAVGDVADIEVVRAEDLIEAGAAVGASGPATHPGRMLRLVNDAVILGREYTAGEVVEAPDWLAPGMIERGEAHAANGPATRLGKPARTARAAAR